MFVAAAVNVSEIDINTYRVSDSVLADAVLCSSKSVWVVHYGNIPHWDRYVPSELPQKLQHLELSFG